MRPLMEVVQARAVEQRSWMLSIAPNHLPNLGPDSPVSNSNVPIGPALPSGLNRIQMNPNLIAETSHCGTQRICGHTGIIPALNCLLEDGPLLTIPFSFASPIDGVKTSFFTPHGPPQFLSSKILPKGTQPHQLQ